MITRCFHLHDVVTLRVRKRGVRKDGLLQFGGGAAALLEGCALRLYLCRQWYYVYTEDPERYHSPFACVLA